MIRVPQSALKWLRLHRTDCESTADYAKSVEHDFSLLLPHLPDKADSILDIGCGLAGIDVLLKTKYPDARLELLDGNGPESNFRGMFADSMSPFNDRAVTEELLMENGIVPDKWHDIGTTETLKADIVISLLSWGWHYPLKNYTVDAPLVICDLRNTEGTILHDIVYKGRHKGYRCSINANESQIRPIQKTG